MFDPGTSFRVDTAQVSDGTPKGFVITGRVVCVGPDGAVRWVADTVPIRLGVSESAN